MLGIFTAFVLLLQLGCMKKETPAVAGASGSAKEAVVASAAGPARLSFNEHVQPILAENCYACHGADAGSRKAELRLDKPESAFASRKDSGPAIVRGKPDESLLVRRIESTNEKERMPPAEAHKTLKPEQSALLRQWVAEGAEYQEHWAFIAPVRKKPPAVAALNEKFVRNPIDRFIAARLEREGLAPSAEGDRRALIRRVTLDLTGIVPAPSEVEAFVADKSPDAYERVVDRLLASPRFGEHRARYWLDYVRYADTHGLHFDNLRAIWPYRDYVIRAFNANKPFDQFVREQLAGDLLPAKTMDELAATGFMRCNLTTNEGGTVTEEVIVNQTRDRVEAFGATFLGLTTGCAACHDHKFDPIKQTDFYGLAAYLGNTVEKAWDFNIADPEPVLRMPKDVNRPAAAAVFGLRTELQKKLEERRGRARELTAAWLAEGKRPKAVSAETLELRLRLDEGRGDTLKNSAPGAKIATFKADTNPLLWGENSWFWPSMRMDILTRIPLGDVGDVEAGERFSAGGWLMLRAKPGGSGTGNGALLARMGDDKRKGGAGWDIFHENGQFVVNLVAATNDETVAPVPETAVGVAAIAGAAGTAANANATPRAVVKRGIAVATRATFPRDKWLHVFFTYDGSRRGPGVRIYVNGKLEPVDVKLNTLTPRDSIRTDVTTHLGRRDEFMPMRENRFQ
ncbi:MAG: DUF1549 domain-containing protein, partial [Opitutaceae bacterium]